MVWNIKSAKHKMEWHRWFAWHPVKVEKNSDGSGKIAWLCHVDRKCTWHGKLFNEHWSSKYRLRPSVPSIPIVPPIPPSHTTNLGSAGVSCKLRCTKRKS